ncbi:unnamed protein product, partial [Dicrocoelium dendriticum]
RFEIPANSYVEFVRVIWPGGIATTKYSGAQTPVYSFDSSSSSSVEDPQSVWDIFHRSVISQRRNVTEIVARFREDLVNNVQTLKNSPATEVYKLLFRVTRPPVGSAGRVAPRIFWSLVSLRRRESSDHAVGGSPIVTRLNIESSELVHLVMVLKSSALVNLAALTGEPSVHPVWVYGLTYDAQVVDVTKRATCHTGDDAIIHFANDACDRLGFSGAELDGSPALPLVTKLDGRSATINLLVWFPKSPALRLAVGTSTQGIQNSGGSQKVDQVLMKRLDTETSGMGTKREQSVCRKTGRIQLNDTNSMCYFQYLPVRVLARFILAGSVLYDKDVLGGHIDQFVDVTEYTAHRLRVDNLAGDHSNANSVSLDVNQRPPALPLLLHKSGDIKTLGTTEAHSKHANNVPYLRSTTKPGLASSAAWIVGKNPGKFRIWLEPVDRSRLDNAIPPGLAKQLREHLSDSDDSNQSRVVYASDEHPSLEIRVTDEVSVRAVGISAQLLTGFSMKLSHGIDSNLEREPISSEHGLNSLTEPLPLYSGLYALQYTLLGGSLVHSGTVNTSSTDSKTRLSGQTTSWRLVATTNASQESSNASNVEPMYLAIWIHLDDGSTLLWSHMVELYRDAHRSLPFQLTVDNLRPDLVHVSGTNVNHHTRRRRHTMDFPVNCHRGTPSFAQHISRVSGSDFRQRQHIRVMDGVQFEENDKPCEEYDAQTWSGPVVRVLRHDTAFIGEVYIKV